MTDTDAFGGDGGLIAVDPVSGHQAALSQAGNFVDPAGVALAADGTILVSDMEAFGGTGGLIRVDPGSGAPDQDRLVVEEFLRPLGLAVEASGQVVVAYTERPPPPPNPGIVMRVNAANGEHHLVSPDAHMLFPAFLAHDASGWVLATEPDAQGADSRLFRLVEGGGADVLLEGKPEGAIYGGLAVEPNGSILVASAGQLEQGARCCASIRRAARLRPWRAETSWSIRWRSRSGPTAASSSSTVTTGSFASIREAGRRRS